MLGDCCLESGELCLENGAYPFATDCQACGEAFYGVYDNALSEEMFNLEYCPSLYLIMVDGCASDCPTISALLSGAPDITEFIEFCGDPLFIPRCDANRLKYGSQIDPIELLNNGECNLGLNIPECNYDYGKWFVRCV